MSITSPNDNLKTRLITGCEQRYTSMSQFINSTLIYLFRGIGTVYNRYCDQAGVKAAHHPELHDLANNLQHKYGPYFNSHNILLMAKFDSLVSKSDQLLQTVMYFTCVTWEHMVQLLPFDDLDIWLYYIRLIEKDGLSAEELQQLITSKAFENDETFLGKSNLKKAFQKTLTQNAIDQEFLPLWLLQHRREWKPLPNVFKEPLLSLFKPLVQLNEYPVLGIDNISDKNILTEIIAEIDGVRVRINQSLNEQFNLFFWETGRQYIQDQHLPQTSSGAGHTEQHKVKVVQVVHWVDDNNHSHEFSKTIDYEEFEQIQSKKKQQYKNLFDTLFNTQQLALMLEFATKINDSKLVMPICHLATLEQLKELIKLNDQQQILAMAFQIADQNLSAGQVRQLVNTELQNPQKKKKEKLTNNSIYNKKVAVNILNNNLFMQFVSAF